MNSLILWLVPVVLLLIFFGLPSDTTDETGIDEPEQTGDKSLGEGGMIDQPAETSVPVEYQHHWERRHRNRRII